MPATTDALDLSIPSTSKDEGYSNTLQEQVLDLSSDRITIPEQETTITLHSGVNITRPEEKPEGLKSPSSAKSEFKIKVVDIKKHKSKYSFRCNMCEKIMHSVARFFFLFLWLCILHCAVLGNIVRWYTSSLLGSYIQREYYVAVIQMWQAALGSQSPFILVLVEVTVLCYKLY